MIVMEEAFAKYITGHGVGIWASIANFKSCKKYDGPIGYNTNTTSSMYSLNILSCVVFIWLTYLCFFRYNFLVDNFVLHLSVL